MYLGDKGLDSLYKMLGGGTRRGRRGGTTQTGGGSGEANKVDDVTVNGSSVVEDKVAKIDLTGYAKRSELSSYVQRYELDSYASKAFVTGELEKYQPIRYSNYGEIAFDTRAESTLVLTQAQSDSCFVRVRFTCELWQANTDVTIRAPKPSNSNWLMVEVCGNFWPVFTFYGNGSGFAANGVYLLIWDAGNYYIDEVIKIGPPTFNGFSGPKYISDIDVKRETETELVFPAGFLANVTEIRLSLSGTTDNPATTSVTRLKFSYIFEGSMIRSLGVSRWRASGFPLVEFAGSYKNGTYSHYILNLNEAQNNHNTQRIVSIDYGGSMIINKDVNADI